MSNSVGVTQKLFNLALYSEDVHHIFSAEITEKNFLDLLVTVADSLRINARDRFVGIVSPRVSEDKARELHSIADTFAYYLCIDHVSKRFGDFNIAYSDIRVLKKPDSVAV